MTTTTYLWIKPLNPRTNKRNRVEPVTPDALNIVARLGPPLDWLEHGFMVRALAAMMLLAPTCAAMGVHVVNFRMSFFSDAISHSAFTGIALGLVLSIDPRIAMILFGLLVGLGITHIRRGSDLSSDAVIGVFFSSSVALGIAIISAKKGLTRSLESFLYGDILAVTNWEFVLAGVLFAVVMIFMYLSYNRLIMISISPVISKTRGINVKVYEYAFALLLALVITASIRAGGILLVTALLIVPAVAGRNFARNAAGMFWYSIMVALLSSFSGIVGSYYLNTSTGATVILFAAGFFALSYLRKALVKE